VIHFTDAVWDEVMQWAYIHINTEAASEFSTEEKDDAFHKDWIQQGIEGFDFSSHISLSNDFAMCCISGVVRSCDDYQDGKSSNGVEEGDINLNHCQKTKVYAASKIVNHALT
jgi:hypothetical protein